MAQVKNIKIGNTSYGITDANTLPALNDSQKTTLLLNGTYLGSSVSNNAVFERPDGTFEKFNITSGTGFTTKSLNSSNNWRCGAYGNGTFVIGSIGTESYPLEYSTDRGDTWQQSTPTSGGWTMYANWYICYGNGMFVTARGPTNAIGYSTDGITWIRHAVLSTSGINWASVAYGGNRFAFCAEGSGIINLLDKNLTSSSLVNLTVPYSGTVPTFSCVCYGNGKFVFVDKSNRAWYIADNSTTAVAVSMPASRNWHRTAYGNGVFVAIALSSDKGAYSSDGITWTEMSMPRSAAWDGITWDGTKFIAIASGKSYYATSSDGITWTEASLPISTTWESIISDGNGTIVVVSSNSSTVYKSSDFAYSTTAISYNKEQVDSALAAKQGSLTAGTGISITNSTISNTGLINTSTGATALTVGGTPSSYANSTNVGNDSSITGSDSTALGKSAASAWRGVAIGCVSSAGAMGIAIGYGAVASANNVQIGSGTNGTANTLQFRSYQVINASGVMPIERLGGDSSAASPTKFLREDGTWQTAGGSAASYDSATKTITL